MRYGNPRRALTDVALARRQEAELREYRVDTADGFVEVHANFAFNNGSEGLVFRRYRQDGTDKTYVVACFAAGSWSSFGEVA